MGQAQSTTWLVEISAAAFAGAQLGQIVADHQLQLAPERHRLLQVAPELEAVLLVIFFWTAHSCPIMAVG